MSGPGTTAAQIIEALLVEDCLVGESCETPTHVAARAYLAGPAKQEEALIEAGRAYKLEDLRTGHIVAEIGQRASLYSIGNASEALFAAARAISIGPTAVHDVLLVSADRADKAGDPDLAIGLRRRAAQALPIPKQEQQSGKVVCGVVDEPHKLNGDCVAPRPATAPKEGSAS